MLISTLTKRTAYILCSAFFLICTSYAQKKVQKTDSLTFKKYSYLIERIDQSDNEQSLQLVYSHAWLVKAKQEHNTIQLFEAYQNLLHLSPKSLRLFYADSILNIALSAKRNDLIGSAHLTKGIVFYGQNDFEHALDQYLLASTAVAQTKDEYLAYKIKFNIGTIKYYLGFYEEALGLLTDCSVYFKGKEPRPYLNSLHALALCQIRMHNYKDCSATNTIGIIAAAKTGTPDFIPYFNYAEGINLFYLGKYESSLQLLHNAMPAIALKKDKANESVLNLYIAKNLIALDKIDVALGYFKKVDTAFVQRAYIRPDLKDMYGLLMDYYKKKGDRTNELYYGRQLAAAGKALDIDKNLTHLIDKNYDNAETVRRHADDEHRSQIVMLSLAL